MIISDHSIIRLLERKYGFDADELRKELLSKLPDSCMDCKFPLGEGFHAQIRSNMVTTILFSSRKQYKKRKNEKD